MYTLKQRNKIYKKAHKRTNVNHYLVCLNIGFILGIPCERVTEELFPELHLFRNPAYHGNAWLSDERDNNYDSVELRKTVLEFCIEMTRP